MFCSFLFLFYCYFFFCFVCDLNSDIFSDAPPPCYSRARYLLSSYIKTYPCCTHRLNTQRTCYLFPSIARLTSHRDPHPLAPRLRLRVRVPRPSLASICALTGRLSPGSRSRIPSLAVKTLAVPPPPNHACVRARVRVRCGCSFVVRGWVFLYFLVQFFSCAYSRGCVRFLGPPTSYCSLADIFARALPARQRFDRVPSATWVSIGCSLFIAREIRNGRSRVGNRESSRVLKS